MNKHIAPLIVCFTLTIAILACAFPVPSVGQPAPRNSSASPDPNQVSTIVALTLTALVPGGDSPTAPVTTSAPGLPAPRLPRTFYYLAPDSRLLTQVFRLERDGTTRRQVTSEAGNVSDYDVSPVDGSVAYVVNNQLLYAQADGSGRRVLVDGGARDPNNPFLNNVSSPVFSLDGQTLAYGYKGLQIYSFSTGMSEMLIQNQIRDAGSGFLVPKELYSPARYSPDGSKLLITLGYYEGASSAIYSPSTKSLVRLQGGEGAPICCDGVRWSPDGSSLYAANPTLGMFGPGLWRVDAATGLVTTLIQGDAGGGNFNLADEAYLAPDGQLYFFFATIPSRDGMISRSPLQLVRSASDGVTGRTVLSEQNFILLNEALWAPDASFVIAAMAPTEDVYVGGQAKVFPLNTVSDMRGNFVLAAFARQMKWGP